MSSASVNIAVIPARGGSQRIPRKNIRQLNGKPLVAYSIEAALDSQLFDKVIVSTDDEEIATVAKNWGAEVPFIRPNTLSDHFTGTTPVMQHALHALGNSMSIENACLIYATCPLLQAQDIIEGYKALKNLPLSFSATTYDFPIQRALSRKGGKLQPMFPEYIASRSQDLEEPIHDAGQFYWGTKEQWLENPDFFSELALPVMLPRHRIQDLDTEEDWARLESLFIQKHTYELGS
ncbi:pseudaminic acid cytidylyltransferase [Marinomonas balearica]|uniref:N-acylneuraminate cytidylyltransferase/pseudaminic acid cytidylyltransferase n=1 Tax=Marinomonas balearica TaxID=491947 RepID=A0A4R6M4U4_9GAMM|nr:pseudaminic acid cytidylyltransferase [Marinomonas balearica]TDO96254.1 N-acylneuraminate cytidylyltransferase/pseudaminic acid cytidylyltransferase [Marinomonas balearica]